MMLGVEMLTDKASKTASALHVVAVLDAAIQHAQATVTDVQAHGTGWMKRRAPLSRSNATAASSL